MFGRLTGTTFMACGMPGASRHSGTWVACWGCCLLPDGCPSQAMCLVPALDAVDMHALSQHSTPTSAAFAPAVSPVTPGRDTSSGSGATSAAAASAARALRAAARSAALAAFTCCSLASAAACTTAAFALRASLCLGVCKQQPQNKEVERMTTWVTSSARCKWLVMLWPTIHAQAHAGTCRLLTNPFGVNVE